MLVIRLSRTGKKNAPSYRLVVADKKRAVKGKYIDILGHYNPISEPKVFQANKEKVEAYLKNGAQISVTALNLLCDNGILPKNRKIKIVHAKSKAEVAEEKAEKEEKAEEASAAVTEENAGEATEEAEKAEETPEESIKEEEPAVEPTEEPTEETAETEEETSAEETEEVK